MFPTMTVPPPSSSDEPTGQYSREHLKQLAELHSAKPSAPSAPPIELPRLVSLQPKPRPLSEIHTERPPPPEPLPETVTAAPPRYAEPTLPPPAFDMPAAGGPAPGQDGRAAAPLPPARSDAVPAVRVAGAPPPARIDPPATFRPVDRPAFSRPPPATPQGSYLPSQIAPPLIRDPRANRVPATAARGTPHFTRGVVLGVVVSLGLVVASTLVALYFMRDGGGAGTATEARPPPAGERSAALGRSEVVTAPQIESPASAMPAASGAVEATPEVPASAEAAPSATEAPAATAGPGASAASAAVERGVAVPNVGPSPRVTVPAARAPRAAPKQPAKKRPRFVPEDI
jgi:hypothetical protein